MALQWNSTLAVGDAEIDAQHRELFRRVDRLVEAVLHRDRSEAASILEYLRTFVVEHFAAEERLMAEVGYPDAEAHAAEHRAFAAALREVDARYQANGCTAAVVHDLERRVVSWLAEHVYSTDVALGKFVQARADRKTAAAC